MISTALNHEIIIHDFCMTCWGDILCISRCDCKHTFELEEYNPRKLDNEILLIMRRNYLRELRGLGVRIADWNPDTPVEKLLEALK